MANRLIKSRKWKMIARSFLTLLVISYLGLVCIQCQTTHSPLTPPPSEKSFEIRSESAEQPAEYVTVIQPAEIQQESLPAGQEKAEHVHAPTKEKPKTCLCTHREKAIEWLDEKATRAPRHHVVQYVDFVSENVEPRFQLLVLAILTIESEGDANAKSDDGSLGLTQILPRCWERELKAQGIINQRKDFFDYRKNILACQYILQYHSADGRSLNKTLMGYNHSKKYVKRVIARMNDLKKAL